MRYIFILVLFFTSAVSAQKPFTKTVWLNDEGAHIRVNAMLNDKTGALWLATTNGIFFFNGRVISPSVDSSRNVTAITAYRAGLIYGCKDGAVYSSQNDHRKLLLKAASPVQNISQTPYGILISTEGDGVYAITANNIVLHFTMANGLPDNYIYNVISEGGSYLLGTDLDFFRGTVGQGAKFQFEEIYGFGDITRVVRAVNTQKATVWLGFQERGIAIAKNVYSKLPEISGLTDPHTWAWGQVNDILPVSDSAAWVVTEKGWLLYASKSFADTGKSIHIDTTLCVNRPIHSLKTDNTGNIWLGTDWGLTQVTVGSVYYHSIDKNYHLQGLAALAMSGENGLWYNQDRELWFTNLATKQQHKEKEWSSTINCLYTDATGMLWIGTSGDGLWTRLADGSFKPTNVPELKAAYILNVSGAGDRLWVSTLSGVYELKVTRDDVVVVNHYSKSSGIGSDIVYQVFTDSRQRTWFGTDGAGIAMNDGGKWYKWGANAGFRSGVIYSIAEDNKGDIWVATLHDGIFKFNNRHWQQFGKDDGLQDETINSLIAGNNGHVFAASVKGIDEWYPSEKIFRHFNKRNMPDVDSFSYVLNVMTRTKEGYVVAPYNKGILIFAGSGTAGIVKPKVTITGAQLYFNTLPRLPRTLTHDQDHITFDFKGINFIQTERLHYRYRLDGFNSGWVTTSDEFVTYPRLPSGDYMFIIQASLDESFNNPVQAAWAFSVTAPFWKTWWFWIPVGTVIAIGLYFLLRWRVRSIQKMSRIQHERTQFEYEHLKSQVNPHFLFNSFNTLAALIVEEPNVAVTYTEQLSELYRNSLAENKEDLITIEEEWQALDRYFFIQHMRFGEGLQLSDLVPRDTKRTKKIVPLALQILVENAIKHNAVSRYDPLVITIAIEGDYLVVRNALKYKKHKEKSMGLGLKNIRQRYALVTNLKIEANKEANEFIVKLPLL